MTDKATEVHTLRRLETVKIKTYDKKHEKVKDKG